MIPTKGLYDYLFLTTKMFGGVDVGAIWFLPALFLTKNIFNIISHLPHKNQIIAFANVLIIIAYTIFSVKQIILGTFPFCIFPGIASVPFFTVGTIYRKRKIAHSAILLLALFYFVWCLFTQHTMVIAGGKYNFYILDFIAGIGGTLLMLLICKLIVQYKHLNSAISYIGRISLLILCVHSLQLTLGLRALTSETFSQIFFMLVASVPISMLLYKSKLVQKLF